MKYSGIILYIIIASSLCFFSRSTTGQCLSPIFCVSYPTNNLHGIAPRRVLSTYHIQHESKTVKVSDARKYSSGRKAYRREEPLKNSIHNDDTEDELVYHIDYHGVSTHPSPSPKHGKP
ncbi:unnamed protein product [Amaranthus hypochondriacus]